MNPSKVNDSKGLCFSVIIIAAVVLTYFGSLAFPDASQSNVWERLAATPSMLTVYVFAHDLPPGYIYIGWMGSVVIYFGLGVAVMLAIQYLIKKRGDKKTKTTRI